MLCVPIPWGIRVPLAVNLQYNGSLFTNPQQRASPAALAQLNQNLAHETQEAARGGSSWDIWLLCDKNRPSQLAWAPGRALLALGAG